MKDLFSRSTVARTFALCLSFMAIANCNALASGPEKDAAANTRAQVKVLVVGLADNVSSNYFPKTMITEETGIPADSICAVYNESIARNMERASDKEVQFVYAGGNDGLDSMLHNVRLSGHDEDMYADSNSLDKDSYAGVVSNTGADYVLLLNQHYLRWQEEPMRTLFHITSYTLLDRQLTEVTHGNNYFTTMELDNQSQLAKDSRKSSNKIASSVAKSIRRR